MNTSASFHVGPDDSLEFASMDHGLGKRSLSVELTGEYGGFVIFCNAVQAQQLACGFTEFAASFDRSGGPESAPAASAASHSESTAGGKA